MVQFFHSVLKEARYKILYETALKTKLPTELIFTAP